MPRQRNAYVPRVPDEWVETEAHKAGVREELIQREGRSPEKRRKRYHLLEELAKPRQYGKHKSPPLITGKQMDAGLALNDAWCETQRSPDPKPESVDSSPDWDAIALGQVERVWKLSAVTKLIPPHCRDVVLQVCTMQIPTEDMDTLKEGLDAIAEGLGL